MVGIQFGMVGKGATSLFGVGVNCGVNVGFGTGVTQGVVLGVAVM